MDVRKQVLAGMQTMYHAGREEKERNCFITFQGVSRWTDITRGRERGAIRGWRWLDISHHHFDGLFLKRRNYLINPPVGAGQGNLMLTEKKCKVANIVHKAFWCEYQAGGKQLCAYR